MSDILWAFVVIYLSIGTITYLLDAFLHGVISDTFTYNFRDLKNWELGLLTICACVGAWPMVLLHLILKKK